MQWFNTHITVLEPHYYIYSKITVNFRDLEGLGACFSCLFLMDKTIFLASGIGSLLQVLEIESTCWPKHLDCWTSCS